MLEGCPPKDYDTPSPTWAIENAGRRPTGQINDQGVEGKLGAFSIYFATFGAERTLEPEPQVDSVGLRAIA